MLKLITLDDEQDAPKDIDNFVLHDETKLNGAQILKSDLNERRYARILRQIASEVSLSSFYKQVAIF